VDAGGARHPSSSRCQTPPRPASLPREPRIGLVANRGRVKDEDDRCPLRPRNPTLSRTRRSILGSMGRFSRSPERTNVALAGEKSAELLGALNRAPLDVPEKTLSPCVHVGRPRGMEYRCVAPSVPKRPTARCHRSRRVVWCGRASQTRGSLGRLARRGSCLDIAGHVRESGHECQRVPVTGARL